MSLAEIFENYLQKNDPIIKENANKKVGSTHLENYVFWNLVQSKITDILPSEFWKDHVEGWYHINKLLDGALFKMYCQGLSPQKILLEGLWYGDIKAKPPKHMNSAVDQIVNWLYEFSLERTGAIAIFGIDIFLAPFIKHDKLDYKAVKQEMQRFIFNLNLGSRGGEQTLFSNVIFGIGVPEFKEVPVYVGGKVVGTVGDFYDEAITIFKAFVENLLEGDEQGKTFTFPIPTVFLTNEFLKIIEKDPELYEKFWELESRFGNFYFENCLLTNRTDKFAFCCRLHKDWNELRKVLQLPHGMWAIPSSLGSYEFVTINLPKIAMEAYMKGDVENHFFDIFLQVLNKVRRLLQWFLNHYKKLFRHGIFSMSKLYIDQFNPFKYMFGTFAVVGTDVTISLFTNNPRIFLMEDGDNIKEIIKIHNKVISFANKVINEFMEEDNIMYDLEQAPAESSAIRLAKICYQQYPKLREFIPIAEDTPFFGNQITPAYTTFSYDTQAFIEGECQKLYTGGVTKHFYFHKYIEPEYMFKLVESTARSYDIVYFSMCPTYSTCNDCGLIVNGIYFECPRCGSKNIDVWQKIVGYLRPLRAWSTERQKEFLTRKSAL